MEQKDDGVHAFLETAGVRAVMVFTDVVEDSCTWWASVFGAPMHCEDGFHWIDLPGPVELGFHPADALKNPAGGSTVPYLSVASVHAALDALLSAGAVLHRGPLDLDDWSMAQIRDPFGTVIGITDR